MLYKHGDVCCFQVIISVRTAYTLPSLYKRGMLMDEGYAVERFDGALMLLPYRVRDRLRDLGRVKRAKAEEIRMRVGEPVSVVMPEGETGLGGDPVTKKELDYVLELATGASVHAVREKVRQGFLTVRGGYRLGICGSVSLCDGAVGGFQSVSSVALRISRQALGCGTDVLQELRGEGELPSTLIISPPGGGKTTLLRDLVRLVSSGTRPLRTALADERSEIAAFWDGEPRMDVGRTTDVLDGCPKAEGITMLLRSMNPEIIAVDEITKPEDTEAIITAANCGVKLLATAHARDYAELHSRPHYRRLLDSGVFEALVTIERTPEGRSYAVGRLRA